MEENRLSLGDGQKGLCHGKASFDASNDSSSFSPSLEEELRLLRTVIGGDLSSSSSSSSGSSSSGSVSMEQDTAVAFEALSNNDDSSTESDSGWSDTSGNSGDMIFRASQNHRGVRDGGQRNEGVANEPAVRTTGASYDVTTDIIEKIIQTRRRSFDMVIPDAGVLLVDQSTPGKHDLVASGGLEKGVASKASHGSSSGMGTLRTSGDDPPPPPPHSPLQPSPKSILHFKDSSPKQPLRRRDSDDEGDAESEEDTSPIVAGKSSQSPRMDRPPPPPLFVDDADTSFRDEWTRHNDGDHRTAQPDVEDSLLRNFVDEGSDNHKIATPTDHLEIKTKVALALALCFCVFLGVAIGVIIGINLHPHTSDQDQVSVDASASATSPRPSMAPTMTSHPTVGPQSPSPTSKEGQPPIHNVSSLAPSGQLTIHKPTTSDALSPTVVSLHRVPSAPHTPILDINETMDASVEDDISLLLFRHSLVPVDPLE